MLRDSPPDTVSVCLVGRQGAGKRSALAAYLARCSDASYASKELEELRRFNRITVRRVLGTVPVFATFSCVSRLDTPAAISAVLGARLVVLVFDPSAEPRFESCSELVQSIEAHAMRHTPGKRIYYAILATKSDACARDAPLPSDVATHLRHAERYAVSTTQPELLLSVFDTLITVAHARTLSKITLKTRSAAIVNRAAKATLPDAPTGACTYGTVEQRPPREDKEELSPAALITGGTARRSLHGSVRLPKEEEDEDESEDRHGARDRGSALARGIHPQLKSGPCGDEGAPVGGRMGALVLEDNPLTDPELDTPIRCDGACTLL